MFWCDLDQHAERTIASAKRFVVLVAPYTKLAIVERLLDHVGSAVEIHLYTRWRVEDVASGVTDTSVLGPVLARGGKVWLIDDLHAKLIVSDGIRGLVGSANLTAAGLGIARLPNFEIMTEVSDAAALGSVLLALRARARPATAEEAESIESAAEALASQFSPVAQPDAQQPLVPPPSSVWAPNFRSPDRLYSLYADAEWALTVAPDAPALIDLVALGVPSGLDRPSFDSHVGSAMLATPLVQALDLLLEDSQRFGAVDAFMANILPGQSRGDERRRTQTLIRWLRHFTPDRYGMATPNYSEVLFRK